MQMLQLTLPAEFVVPLHCWAELPVPTVKVTVWPADRRPARRRQRGREGRRVPAGHRGAAGVGQRAWAPWSR